MLKDPAPDGSDASGERSLETIASFSVDRCHEYTGKGSFTSHSPATIAKSDVVCGGMTLAVDASTRGSRRIRRVEEQLFDVMREVKAVTLPAHGRAPTLTNIVAHTFTPVPDAQVADPQFNASVSEFLKLFGRCGGSVGSVVRSLKAAACAGFVNAESCVNDTSACAAHKCYGSGRGLASTYAKTGNATALREQVREAYAGSEHCIGVVTLGDEIGLPTPKETGDDPALDAAFVDWLRTTQGVHSAEDAGCASWEACRYNSTASLNTTNPKLYFFSKSYSYTYGIEYYRNITRVIHEVLPHAGIGANFSPNPDYVSESFKWVECFRHDCLNMPWSEDYLWTMPLGTQQMEGVRLSQFRAGVRHKQTSAGSNAGKIVRSTCHPSLCSLAWCFPSRLD